VSCECERESSWKADLSFGGLCRLECGRCVVALFYSLLVFAFVYFFAFYFAVFAGVPMPASV